MTKFVAALALLLLACGAGAQETQKALGPTDRSQLLDHLKGEVRLAVLTGVAQRALAGKDYGLLEAAASRLHAIRPYIGEYRYLLARAYALQDKKSEAYDALVGLQRQGLAFALDGDDDFDNLRGYQLYDYLVENFNINGQAVGKPTTAISLSRADLLLDGMAWDPQRKQFLVASVVAGTIYHVQPDGTLVPFIQPNEENGLLGVFDIEVDAQRGTVWAASAAVAHFRQVKYQDIGRTGIYQFDLATGKFQARYELPVGGQPQQLANLAVAPDGTVFASNALAPEVYRLGLGDDALTRFFHAPGFTALRDLAVDPSGSYLFFADYELGLFGASLTDRKAFQIKGGEQVNLGGIDGLEWYKNGMILIQNGNQPNRVLRVALTPDARSVGHAQTLLANYPEIVFPSEGTMVGDDFFLMASTGKESFDPRTGKIVEGANLRNPVVLKTDVNEGWRPASK